jgi:diguanylate cyclase (GGDEF)-like protein
MKDNDSSLVLIVDDNEQNISVLKNILHKSSYRVIVAKNGQDALGLVQSEHPSVILMDIIMPGMDGIETCKTLKAMENIRDIPVIFITALSETSEKIRAFEAGGVDYIDRPFVREEVLARINVHVRLNETMQKLKTLSVTDELTGSFNRRFAYQMLERQIKISKRDKEPFVICYLDIDNLKKVNDTHGHDTGDRLIKMTVESLNSIIRKSDFLFRMGGDEFLILFPRARLKESSGLIERIHASLNQQKIDYIVIYFSFGFSEYNLNKNATAESLIAIADAQMYQLKLKKKGTH